MTEAPSPSRRLSVPGELLERVHAHARRRFPEECCGILVGREGEPETRVCRLSEADNVWPGARRDRYEIDPSKLLAAQVSARDEGLTVVGYYHSHPAAPAVPSGFDLERAWPGISYLIASVAADGRVTARSWRLDPDGGRFVEERIERLD